MTHSSLQYPLPAIRAEVIIIVINFVLSSAVRADPYVIYDFPIRASVSLIHWRCCCITPVSSGIRTPLHPDGRPPPTLIFAHEYYPHFGPRYFGQYRILPSAYFAPLGISRNRFASVRSRNMVSCRSRTSHSSWYTSSVPSHASRQQSSDVQSDAAGKAAVRPVLLISVSLQDALFCK